MVLKVDVSCSLGRWFLQGNGRWSWHLSRNYLATKFGEQSQHTDDDVMLSLMSACSIFPVVQNKWFSRFIL